MTIILAGHGSASRPRSSQAWLVLVARLLRAASAALARRAREVARPLHAHPGRLGQHAVSIEFHAEAGAPEGALYVDGEVVGYLDVRRL